MWDGYGSEAHGGRDTTSVTVELTPEDLARIETLAHGRNDPKEGKIATRRVDGKRDDLELNLLGLRGEFAVAKHLGVSLNYEIHMRGRKNKYDLIYAGQTIEVTVNSYPGGDLYFNAYFDADYAVLVVPAPAGAMRIAGYASREEFRDLSRIVNYGHGDRLAMSQWQLRPIEELKALAQGKMF